MYLKIFLWGLTSLLVIEVLSKEASSLADKLDGETDKQASKTLTIISETNQEILRELSSKRGQLSPKVQAHLDKFLSQKGK